MSNQSDIREAAQEWAQVCIDNWAREDAWEVNDVLGTEFTDEEAVEVTRLAETARAVLPE